MVRDHLLIPGWVYDMADYRQMFDLSEADLSRKILDFPGGISSFNAEMYDHGYEIVSGDPSYASLPEQMTEIADEILGKNKQFLHKNIHRLKDQSDKAVIQLEELWLKNKARFIADYARGKMQRRYQAMQLPTLPFSDHSFELLLCSDLLFHKEARHGLTPAELMAELTRVALEVRIFPILNDRGEMSASIGPLMLDYQQKNFNIELRQVAYEVMKGGNAMLRIWSKRCVV